MAVALLVASGLVVGAAPANAAVPDENPDIRKQCGLDITLVLDASGSVSQANAVGNVREAANAFLTGFQDTGSTARVLQFASFAGELAPRAIIDEASMDTGGAFRNAVDDYYDPRPPQPAGVNMYRYSSNRWQQVTGQTYWQYTNWDQGMRFVEQDPGDYVIFITDGDPTSYDFRPGDPVSPPHVAVGLSEGDATTLDHAVLSANAVKQTGARVLALGVGNAVDNATSRQRLTQISGPVIAQSMDEFDAETTDVAVVSDFADLADAARALVLDLCSPSVTIRKMAQSATDGTFSPAPDWDITLSPSVTGGFDWVLPEGTTGDSATVATNADGFAQFQWEPEVDDAPSSAVISEVLEPGFIAGRPDDDDYQCTFQDAEGTVRTVSGELAEGPDGPTFELDPIGTEVGTCTLFNSYDFQPDIELTKVDTPTEVRGDVGSPDGDVTSTFTVTNPGNTPLSDVTVTDDRCAVVPLEPDGVNVGDLNADRRLDPGEEWQFACVRTMLTSLLGAGPTTVVNTATVVGIAPDGTLVDDEASDEVQVYVPRIELQKLVNGQDSVTIALTDPPTAVTYAYTATNTGNTDLTPVTLTDDTAPCENPEISTQGDGDEVMAPDESWTWTCTAAPTQSVINTATVTAGVQNPVTGGPFPGANPPVTADADAEVDVELPGLSFTKTVDRDLVFPGTTSNYTFTATNTGTLDLRNDTGVAGWVVDDVCAPVVYAAGDDGDGLMNPGETWTFTCSHVTTTTTVNTAVLAAQPVAGGEPVGPPLVRRDQAIVEVIEPAIEVTKVALRGVVLDPDAQPVSGPDTPTPRPAEYIYAVANTGPVPIRDLVLDDDKCDSPTLVAGDGGQVGVLDIDEVWEYVCATPLERQQGTPPPLGAESAMVQNVATATGTSFLPDEPDVDGPGVEGTDRAQVLVIEPALTLTKTASVAVTQPGRDVTYTFAVANTGDVGLQPLAITDDKCPDITYVSGDNGNGFIDGANTAAAETWIFTCTRPLAVPEEGETDVNVAGVSALDTLGNVYEATAEAEVRVIDPAIQLEKFVNATLVPAGTTVQYTFEVTNAGGSPSPADDVLAEILLADGSRPANPGCELPVFVGGDDDGDGLLDREPEETWVYTCEGVILEPTTDTAGVRGIGGTQYGLRLPVFDFDSQFVEPFHPAISIEKTANPTELVEPGGAVTYSYTVTNTGDVPLAGVADTISDDTCSPLTYVSGDLDEDGLLDTPQSIFEDAAEEAWTFTCTTQVSRTTVNTVVVTGTPVDADGVNLCAPTNASPAVVAGRVGEPCDVEASDTAEVRVVPPLPATGGQIAWGAIAAGIAGLGAGVALLAWSRRRRI
ncbi:LPXTG cell wall anchor domain-containing protein [Microbacterium ureisolvens]|uniref:DUF7507 domain-containing protein n=1 Tax=Microbacterium ureisolvens TaxID=2781186 RepID=UPI003630CE26